MAPTFEIDESRFPLVFVAFRGPIAIDALDGYFARIDRFCKERRRFALVVDTTRAAVPSAGVRKHVADAIAARKIAFGRHCVGVAIVITNALLRGATTAVLWIEPFPHPHEIVATKGEGQATCERWLSVSAGAVGG